MINIENVDVHGVARAIYSARNAMNSWDKSDSRFETDTMGENDLKLAKQLVKAGTDHSKFMRMITVTCDITAPQFWAAELDTYKIATVRNSCSFQHKGTSKPFSIISGKPFLSFQWKLGCRCRSRTTKENEQ